MCDDQVKAERMKILADHFEKTFESATYFWRERNKFFFWVLSASGIVILLNWHVVDDLLLGRLLFHYASMEAVDAPENEIRVMLRLLSSVLLIAMLVLIIIIYQRTRALARYYEYLKRLEDYIRKVMKIDNDDKIVFTREGTLYEDYLTSDRLQGVTGLVYVLLLGLIFLVVAITWFANTPPFATSIRSLDGRLTALSIADCISLTGFAVYLVSYALSSGKKGFAAITMAVREARDRKNLPYRIAKELHGKWREGLKLGLTSPQELKSLGEQTERAYEALTEEERTEYRDLAKRILNVRGK